MPLPFARLSAFDLQAAPRVVTAHSSRLDRVSGDGWLAVGDAAMASGIRAGEVAAMDEYDRKANEVFRTYYQLRGVYSGREQRWPQSVFWRRRHVVVQAPEHLVGVPIGRVGPQPGKQGTYMAVGVGR